MTNGSAAGIARQRGGSIGGMAALGIIGSAM